MVLQLLFAIGIREDILPVGKDWYIKHCCVKDNNNYKNFCITEVVLKCYLCTLDVYYSLRLSRYTEEALTRLEHKIRNLHLHALRLFACKQSMIGQLKSTSVIKLHLLSHLPHCIREYGPTQAFDMNMYESLHKYYVKSRFRMTSGRVLNEHVEMMSKVINTLLSLT